MAKEVTLSQVFNSPDFLLTMVNSLNDAVCVVNTDLRIVYLNQAASRLFNKSEKEILGKKFGFSIGCKEHSKAEITGICGSCRIRLSMLAAINSGVNQEKESIVIQMDKNAAEDVRLIGFQSHFMEFEGNRYAVVIINDMTKMGKETLDFISAFYAEKS